MIHGKDKRIISKWEILGRLHFCGFTIIKTEVIDKKLCFIAKKIKSPLEDKSPSYGPIFKQKRIGINGEIIYTYKFRTMHPYSEYIHKYILNQFKLNPIGKIKNDIRITFWGRVMRKYWIDEIPMLINLLQGDLKLVGLRPISKSFFSTYPEDLKKERIKHKPGLFPAFYADMPHSIEEIWESERKYIIKNEKHPWRTNFIYFFRIINNILFHKYRSQ
jgi:lipopolysaccharide/colanic/teichoic acid biosynthesis glycosyltransferase